MEGNIRGKFEVYYENDASGSYLVIEPGEWDQLIDYQVEMITNNPTPSILPISVRRKDNKVRVYYNITSKMPLSQLLRRKFNKNEFINILQGIIKVILESKNYFLSDNCFVLDDELIFLNPDTLETSLVYFPVMNGTDANTGFKEFLIKIVVNAADVVYANDNFIQRILGYAGSNNFNIAEFKRHLDEMSELAASPLNKVSTRDENFLGRNDNILTSNNGKSGNNEAVLQGDTSYGGFKTGNKDNSLPLKPEDMRIPEVKIPAKAGKRTDIPEPVQKVQNQSKPLASRSNPKSTNSTKEAAPERTPSQLIITGAVLQAVILAASGCIVLKIDMKALGNDTTPTYFGIFVIIAALSFLMWRMVLKKVKAVQTVSATPGSKDVNTGIIKDSINMDKYEYKRTDYKPVFPGDSSEKTGEWGDITFDGNKTISLESYAGGITDTVILGVKKEKYPVLKTLKNGIPETIVINKASFIIGRLKGQVDYVHTSSAIGKVHAEIISRDGVYYLKDLNSRNGTYINRTKIESNKEYLINDNDKILLADTEFTFITQ